MKFKQKSAVLLALVMVLTFVQPLFALTDGVQLYENIPFDLESVSTVDDAYNWLEAVEYTYLYGTFYTAPEGADKSSFMYYPDLSESAYKHYVDLHTALYDKVATFKVSDDDAQTELELLRYVLAEKSHFLENWPTRLGGVLTYYFRSGLWQNAVLNAEDIEVLKGDLVHEVTQYASYLEGLKNAVESEIEANGQLPYWLYLDYQRNLDHLLGDIEGVETRYKTFVEGYESAIVNMAGAAPDKNALLGILEAELPKIEKQQAALHALIREQRDNYPEGIVPMDSNVYSAFILPKSLQKSVTPEEVMALGAREVRRIQGELHTALKRLGYFGTLGEQVEAFKADTIYVEGDESRKVHESVMRRMHAKLPAYFHEGDYMTTVPNIQMIDSPYSFHSFNPYEEASKGTFLLSSQKQPAYQTESLTAHETVLGHNLQVLKGYRNLEGRPTVRQLMTNVSYGEGWALYAERLALEEGLIETEEGRVGYLLSELLRAGRLVGDVGINYFGWTAEETVDYLEANTFFTYPEAEVNRYMTMPGQACGYKVGEQVILNLRERAKDALGDDFDLKDFHHVVLKYGSLPMEVLENAVDRYIEASMNK